MSLLYVIIIALMFLSVFAGLGFYISFFSTKKDSHEHFSFICLLIASFLGVLGWFLYKYSQ